MYLWKLGPLKPKGAPRHRQSLRELWMSTMGASYILGTAITPTFFLIHYFPCIRLSLGCVSSNFQNRVKYESASVRSERNWICSNFRIVLEWGTSVLTIIRERPSNPNTLQTVLNFCECIARFRFLLTKCWTEVIWEHKQFIHLLRTHWWVQMTAVKPKKKRKERGENWEDLLARLK